MRANEEGSQQLSPQHYFSLSTRIWDVALASLPLDLVVLILPRSALPSEADATRGIVCFVAIAFGLSFRDPITSLIASFGARDKSPLDRYFPLAVGIIGVILLVKLLPAMVLIPRSSLLFALGGIGFVLFNLVRMYRELKRHREEIQADRSLWAEQATIATFGIVAASIIAARAVSAAGAVTATYTADTVSSSFWLLYGATLLAGILLLLSVRPQWEDFMFRCRRCQSWAPRPLRGSDTCLACAPESTPQLPPDSPEEERERGQEASSPLRPPRSTGGLKKWLDKVRSYPSVRNRSFR